MKTNAVLKHFVIFIVFCIAGCATSDSPTSTQPTGESIGRGLKVEAPSLIESNVAVFPQLGHNALVYNVKLSFDNKYVISADDINGFINLWEVESGRLLRTFWGHGAVVTALAFCPDGKTIASGYTDGVIKIWEIETGKEINTLSGHSQDIFSLDYSSNGKNIVSASLDRTITIWDSESGAELYVFGDSNEVSSAEYSPDNKYIASSTANSLLIWEAANGKKIKILEEGKLYWSASWSIDGKNIVSVDDDGVINIWDVETGKKLISINSGDKERQRAVYLSKDTIVSWSYDGIKIWNVVTGQKINEKKHSKGYISFNRNDRPDGRASVCINRDGKLMVTGSQNEIKFINWITDEVLQDFLCNTTYKQSAHFNRNSQQIVIHRYYGYGDENSLFDLRHAKLQNYKLELDGVVLTDGAFSHDGKKIASLDIFKNRIFINDSKNGNVLKNIDLDPQNNGIQFNDAAFSPDSKYVVVGGENGKENIKIWEWNNGKNGRIVKSLSTEATAAVDWSYNGKYIATGHYRKIKIWNTENYNELFTINGHKNTIWTVAFSPDGKYLATGSNDTTIRIWDLTSRKEVFCIDDNLGSISKIEYSPDGRCLVVAAHDGSIYLYDVSGMDRGLKVERNHRILQVVVFTNGEWIIITPDGYYNASPLGDRYLNVRVGNTVSGIESYRSVFYNPEVVLARLNGKPDPVSKATVTIQEAASFTPPNVTINSPSRSSTTSTAQANLSVAITDQNQPIKNIKILVNGRLVGREELSAIRGTPGLQPEKASITVTGNQQTLNFNLPINLVDPGLNRIEVVAFNGLSENRSHVEVTWNAPAGYRPVLPNLWILAVGVNKYDDSGIRDLNFCVADAKGVIASLKAQEGRRYAKVNSLVIGEGEALKPTADTIKQNLKFLDRAGDRDVILLFLAGHGLSDNAGKFLFLTQDTRLNADKTVNEATAITDSDIVSVLDRTGNLLVFIDACYSGGVESDRLVRTLMDSNAYVFTSSRGSEQSQERRELGHGVFTYSIMDGLKGAQSTKNQGNITVISLSDFVLQDVKRITGGAQNPRGYSRGFADFPLAVIK